MPLSGSKALQEWCKRVTAGYPGVKVENMTKSWKDGLAFCAIIHHYKPELIDFNSLSKKNIRENNTLAFEVAERELGIPALLDPEDMVNLSSPDKLSILTYLSQYYNYFKDKQPGGPPPQKTKLETSGISDRISSIDEGVSEKGREIGRRSLKKAKDKEIKANEPSTSAAVESHTVDAEGGLPTKISLKSDKCEICGKRVYLVERQVVDGRLFHRNCFRCTKCRSTLRPDSYKLTKDPKKFECMCHSEGGDIWNLRMTPTSRAGARLAGVEESNTIWQSRGPRSTPNTPEKAPPRPSTPVKAGTAAGQATGSVTPVSSPAKPPAPNAVMMHPHLMMSAARARFNSPANGGQSSPMASPVVQRRQQNGGPATPVPAQRATPVPVSEPESSNKISADFPPKPVPQPRKSQQDNNVVATEQPSPAKKVALDEKLMTESSSEDTGDMDVPGEMPLFSTDEEERSMQDGDTLSSIGKESRDSTGFESSDVEITKTKTGKSEEDTTSHDETVPAAKPEPATHKNDSPVDAPSATPVKLESKELEEVAGADKEPISDKKEDDTSKEDTLNKVNEVKNQEQDRTEVKTGEVISSNQDKTVVENGSNDVTNKSVEEGSSGDSALWDTKTELSDSYQEDAIEGKKVDDTPTSIHIGAIENKDDKAESIAVTVPETKVEEESTADKGKENNETTEDQQKDEIQVDAVTSSQVAEKEDSSKQDGYEESLNPFGSDSEDEEEKQETLQPPNEKVSKRFSTNPFDSDEDEEPYDESLNPFGDDDDDDEGPVSDSAINPFLGTSTRDTPYTLRLKNQELQPARHSFSHPQRPVKPERPPPPTLSSGSYNVKTRSQILEELKRDRETLKKKRNAPAPPPGGFPGSVKAPPRSRKSRKAPQPPQGGPSRPAEEDSPAKAKDVEATPTPAPRATPTVNGSNDDSKPERKPSPRLRKAQKPERPKYAPPPVRTPSNVGKRRAPAPPAMKREVGKDHIDTCVIQQELQEIESRQRELEQRGVELEKKLRQDGDGEFTSLERFAQQQQ
ncbi:uncharacterized protein [Diadema antillarum]|uniref:uncharacterized protein n=1 Tax=Diadema antillarum TaxID=105358 RepID=UPI003A8695C8